MHSAMRTVLIILILFPVILYADFELNEHAARPPGFGRWYPAMRDSGGKCKQRIWPYIRRLLRIPLVCAVIYRESRLYCKLYWNFHPWPLAKLLLYSRWFENQTIWYLCLANHGRRTMPILKCDTDNEEKELDFFNLSNSLYLNDKFW